MKKLLLISTCIFLLLCLLGCNNTLPISDSNETTTVTDNHETTLSIGEDATQATELEPTPIESAEQNIMPYTVVVDKQNHSINILSKDDNSEYTVLEKSFPMSYIKEFETVEGIYAVGEKQRWHELDGRFVQYSTRLGYDIIIHSPYYQAKDINTLLRESYNLIGKTIAENSINTSITKGSILTTTEAASWISQNCDEGTIVHIVEADSQSVNLQNTTPELNSEKYFTDPTDPLRDSIKENELPYYVYIEKGSFTITVYAKDEKGEYTYPIKSFPTAVGRTPGRTPTGKSQILRKERWHDFWSNGGSAQFISAFHEKIYIHSAVFSLKDNNTLLPKLYNEIGTPATAGCIRTTTEAAYWIYTYCPIGTTVEIVSGSPRGTSAEKQPNIDSKYPGMDPTDPFKPF